MAYATLDDVQALIPRTPVSATTEPTDSQVLGFIAQVDGEVNVALASRGIAIPVVSPALFVEFLKLTNALGAASLTLRAMFPDAAGIGEQPSAGFFAARYTEQLAMIKDGSMIPDSVTTSTPSALPSTFLTRNPDSPEDLGSEANSDLTVDLEF